jgi:hypothetical protein
VVQSPPPSGRLAQQETKVLLPCNPHSKALVRAGPKWPRAQKSKNPHYTDDREYATHCSVHSYETRCGDPGDSASP